MEEEIKLFEEMAVLDVETTKTFKSHEIMHLYLLECISGLRIIIAESNPYIMACSDLRYRSFVIRMLSEYQKQKLPEFGALLAKVITGKYKSN